VSSLLLKVIVQIVRIWCNVGGPALITHLQGDQSVYFGGNTEKTQPVVKTQP